MGDIEKRRLYEMYRRAIDAFGQEDGDREFARWLMLEHPQTSHSADNRIRREHWRQSRANVEAIDALQIAAVVYERMEHVLPPELLQKMSSDYCRSVAAPVMDFEGRE